MWQYADWRSLTSDAERLARLRLHIAEVTQKIGPDVSGGNMSVASGSLTSLLNMLIEEERMLAAVVGGGDGLGGGTVTLRA